MRQPEIPHLRKLLAQGIRRGDVGELLEAIRALDRSVVEISMHIYKVPSRQRAILRKQHRRLHDIIWRRTPLS